MTASQIRASWLVAPDHHALFLTVTLIYLNKSSFVACASLAHSAAERNGTARRRGRAERCCGRSGSGGGAMAGPLAQGWGLGVALRSRAALRPLGLLAPPCRGATAPQCRRATGPGEEVLEENPFYGKYRHKIQELRRLGREGGRDGWGWPNGVNHLELLMVSFLIQVQSGCV